MKRKEWICRDSSAWFESVMIVQCGIQCLLRLPCSLCVLRQGQRRSSRICGVCFFKRGLYILSMFVTFCGGNSKHAMYYADVSEHIALHRYFRDASDEKRERAETLMRYQVGKIVLVRNTMRSCDERLRISILFSIATADDHDTRLRFFLLCCRRHV